MASSLLIQIPCCASPCGSRIVIQVLSECWVFMYKKSHIWKEFTRLQTDFEISQLCSSRINAEEKSEIGSAFTLKRCKTKLLVQENTYKGNNNIFMFFYISNPGSCMKVIGSPDLCICLCSWKSRWIIMTKIRDNPNWVQNWSEIKGEWAIHC